MLMVDGSYSFWTVKTAGMAVMIKMLVMVKKMKIMTMMFTPSVARNVSSKILLIWVLFNSMVIMM